MSKVVSREGTGTGLMAVILAILLGVVVSAALIIPVRATAGDGGFSYHPGEHSGEGILGVAWELDEDSSGWFQIDEDGTVSGSDGCNNFGGSHGHLIRQDYSGRTVVEFGAVVSTMMACPDRGTQQFMTGLTGSEKVTIFLDGDQEGTPSAQVKGDSGPWKTFSQR